MKGSQSQIQPNISYQLAVDNEMPTVLRGNEPTALANENTENGMPPAAEQRNLVEVRHPMVRPPSTKDPRLKVAWRRRWVGMQS